MRIQKKKNKKETKLMYEKEIFQLEKEIDELSPKLEFLEKQMREKVKNLDHYLDKKYRLELGFDKNVEDIV